MASDVGVAIQFRRAGQLGWFNLSIGFVVGAAASHAVFSLVNNRNRPLSVKIRGVVLSFLLLNPLLDGYAVWTGEPQHPDATFTPGVMLGGTRSIELAVESLPESILLIRRPDPRLTLISQEPHKEFS